MRVEIPAKNNFIDFPDGMSHEEMGRVISDNWDTIPNRDTESKTSRVLGKSGKVLSSIAEGVSESRPVELGRQIVGLGETAGMVGSGMIGSAAGGMGGLRKIVGGESPEAATKEIQRIAEALTYKPQTKWGEYFAGGAEYGMGLVAGAGKFAGERLQDIETQERKPGIDEFGELPGQTDITPYLATFADVATQTAIFGMFGKITKRIKDPVQKQRFVDDVRKEAKETGKPLDQVVSEKVRETEPPREEPKVNLVPKEELGLPGSVVEIAKTSGIAPEEIKIISRSERPEYFSRYGIPSSIDEGKGIFGNKAGSLFVDDTSGKPVAYLPASTEARGEPPKPPVVEPISELPPWLREEMIRRGLDPKRPLNDVDLANPSIIKAIELDPTLTREQKDQVLKTGSVKTPIAEQPKVKLEVKKETQKEKTLFKWVKDKGGIWDESLPGETAQFLSKESGVVGIVSKKNGKPFDELAKMAVDEGWLSKGSSGEEFRELLLKDIWRMKEKGVRPEKIGKGKISEPEEKFYPKSEEEANLTEKGFDYYGPGHEEIAGDLKPGDKIIMKGEEYTHAGFDTDGNVVLIDGKKLKLDIFEKIPAEAIKESRKEKLPPGVSEEMRPILERIKAENPEEYTHILKGNTAEFVRQYELNRIGKAKGMRQEGMFDEPKTQGGLFPDVGGYARGTAKPSAIEIPELVEIYNELSGGKFPGLVKKLRAFAGRALGQFNTKTGEITLRRDLFTDSETAAKTLSHELGHLTDWLPDETVKRGNILGHIATLKNYLKTLLEAYPKDTDKTFTILTDFDRAKLRKEAKRQLESPKGEGPRVVSADDILQVWNAVEKANPKLKDYVAMLSREQKVEIAKAALKGNVPDWVTFRYADIPSQDIKAIYEKLIADEIIRRGLIERKKVMDELKDLTQKWKPFVPIADDSFTKYRYKPEELYADAISVLFNDPELLKSTAPTFNKAFFDYFKRKPEVLKAYEGIQERIKQGPEAVAAARESRMGAGMKEAEESWKKALEPGEWEDKWLTKAKKTFSDKYASVYDFTKDPKTRRQIENLIYEGAEQQYHFIEVAQKVIKPLEKAKINIDDLEKFYTLNAILKGSRTIKVAGEDARVSIANPWGLTKETAPSVLGRLKERYGEEGFKKLEEAQKAHWEIRQHVIDRLDKANLFPKELMDRIKDNEFYAHFLINDYITTKYGVGVTAGVYGQVGTLKPNAPAFTATVMKDISLLMSAQRKLAAKAVVDDMKANYPDFIKPAETKWNGNIHVPIESSVKGEGLVSFSEAGKIEGYYVPEGIAEAFKKNPVEAWAISRWMGNLTRPFREIFINKNPGFWLFNLKRDFSSALLTLPEAAMLEFAPLWFKSFVPALREAFKGYDPTVQAMLKEKSLIASLDYQGMLLEDIALERMMIKYGLKDPSIKNPIYNQFEKFFRHMDELSAAFERVPKIAAYRYLKEKFPDMSIDEVAERVRRAGSPPFLIKGQATPLTNNIFLFSNAFIRGVETHVRALREDPVEYAWKQTKYTFMPKLLMWAGGAGLLGEGIRQIYERSSDYDKTNYFVIPLGQTPQGRAVTLRVPFDEQSRLIGGVFWKLVTGIKNPKDAMKLFDYTAGQFPGFNPAFSMAGDLISYLGGNNPYDSFRGKLAVPEMIFKAQDERTHKSFAKYLAQQAGLGIIYKFENDDVEKVKTELEKVLGYPIVSNVIGRFIKVSDAGVSEKIRKETEPIDRDLARINLDVKDALTKVVNNKPGEITAKEIDSILYKAKMGREDPMLQQFLKLVVHKGGHSQSRYLEEYLRAGSMEIKVKIISMMIEDYQKSNKAKGGK